MKYYAVCYGHECRWEKAASPSAAARQAFGMVDDTRMTVRQWPSNPRYLSGKAKKEFLESLQQRHKQKTETGDISRIGHANLSPIEQQAIEEASHRDSDGGAALISELNQHMTSILRVALSNAKATLTQSELQATADIVHKHLQGMEMDNMASN